MADRNESSLESIQTENAQLKGRIDELEDRLDFMTFERSMLVKPLYDEIRRNTDVEELLRRMKEPIIAKTPSQILDEIDARRPLAKSA